MSEQIRVLGMNLDNHTVSEQMFLLKQYIDYEGINIVLTLTSENIMNMMEKNGMPALMEHVDMTIIGESIVLEVLDGNYQQQYEEIENHQLEEELFSLLQSQKRVVFWISDEEKDVQKLEQYVQEHYPGLKIQGSYTGEWQRDKLDNLINEINNVAPDVILFQTAYIDRIQQLTEVKNQLNARLCIAFGYQMQSKYWSGGRNSKIKNLIDQTMFKRKALRYQQEEGEE